MGMRIAAPAPPELTCRRLCGRSPEEAAGCVGPLVLAEVTGIALTPGEQESESLLVRPVRGLCMLGVTEQTLPAIVPLPEDFSPSGPV